MAHLPFSTSFLLRKAVQRLPLCRTTGWKPVPPPFLSGGTGILPVSDAFRNRNYFAMLSSFGTAAEPSGGVHGSIRVPT